MLLRTPVSPVQKAHYPNGRRGCRKNRLPGGGRLTHSKDWFQLSNKINHASANLGRLCTGCRFLFGGDGVPRCGRVEGCKHVRCWVFVGRFEVSRGRVPASGHTTPPARPGVCGGGTD